MKTDINQEICRLLGYGLTKGLFEERDTIYCRNRILGVLKLSNYYEVQIQEENLKTPEPILNNILDWAYENGIIESNSTNYRDLLDTEIMDCLMPRPSEIIKKFYIQYEKDPVEATCYYYNLSISSNYIRMDRVNKNKIWKVKTEYGDIDITINLSKPEKDPKAIAKAKNLVSSTYPLCLLCRQNEGYHGRLNHPARQNHRIIPVSLNNEEWYLQYSPYVYYNEHCIVLKSVHEPMKISKETFDRLLEFVEKFPHYFIGSNADLPIVGGSILSHDHFQGGNYEFAMARAPVEDLFPIRGFEDMEAGIVKWPMSVIRIKGKERNRLSELADFILCKWRMYSDEDIGIISHTSGIGHNTITPIVRRKNEFYEIDSALRNNRASYEHPDGIFHPHKELHHLKKENIGLIEVMGLAVLPDRLKGEMEKIAYHLLNRHMESLIEDEEDLLKHLNWYYELKEKYKGASNENVQVFLEEQVGLKFISVLEQCGVFKRDKKGKEAFLRFIKYLCE